LEYREKERDEETLKEKRNKRLFLFYLTQKKTTNKNFVDIEIHWLDEKESSQ
jgi:hypothetical protein